MQTAAPGTSQSSPPTVRARGLRVEQVDPGASSATIKVTGELDLGSAPVLSTALRAMIDQGQSRIVLDLEQLDFCDASGLKLLLTIDTELRRRGGELELYGPCPSLRYLLQLIPDIPIDFTRP